MEKMTNCFGHILDRLLILGKFGHNWFDNPNNHGLENKQINFYNSENRWKYALDWRSLVRISFFIFNIRNEIKKG